jgi:hypothetical protein
VDKPIIQRAGAAAAVITAALSMGLLAMHAPAPAPAGPPDTVAVQSAYDAEKTSGSPLHRDDLLIQSAQCTVMEEQRYGCQVSYVRKSAAAGRLYFDVISLGPQSGGQSGGQAAGWKLLSGLCRGNKEVSL